MAADAGAGVPLAEVAAKLGARRAVSRPARPPLPARRAPTPVPPRGGGGEPSGGLEGRLPRLPSPGNFRARA